MSLIARFSNLQAEAFSTRQVTGAQNSDKTPSAQMTPSAEKSTVTLSAASLAAFERDARPGEANDPDFASREAERIRNEILQQAGGIAPLAQPETPPSPRGLLG